MNEPKLKQWLTVLLVIGIAALLLGGAALVLNLTATPAEEPVARGYTVPCRMEQGGQQWTAASGCTWQIQSGGTLQIQSGANFTLTNGTITTATVTSLRLNGVNFSGPIRFGNVANAVDGTTIAHGLGTTPTSVLLTAQGTVTASPYVKEVGPISITVGIIGTDGSMTVNWMAGK